MNENNDLRDKAKRLYLKGKSLKDIAAELNISDSTVRSWKKRDEWPKVEIKKSKPKPTKKPQRNIKRERNTKKDVAPLDTLQLPIMKVITITGPLTEKQQLFCEIYVRNFNATQAYLKAYECGYDTARANGYRLLLNAQVKSYVQMLKDIKKETLMAGVEDIVELYMRIAFADMTDYIEFKSIEVPALDGMGEVIRDGNDNIVTVSHNQLTLKNSQEVDGNLITEISSTKTGDKVKLEDRHKALAWLTKYFEMNPEDKHKVAYDTERLRIMREDLELKKLKQELEGF